MEAYVRAWLHLRRADPAVSKTTTPVTKELKETTSKSLAVGGEKHNVSCLEGIHYLYRMNELIYIETL